MMVWAFPELEDIDLTERCQGRATDCGGREDD